MDDQLRALTSARTTGKKLAKWALREASVVSPLSPPTNNLLPSSSAEAILLLFSSHLLLLSRFLYQVWVQLYSGNFLLKVHLGTTSVSVTVCLKMYDVSWGTEVQSKRKDIEVPMILSTYETNFWDVIVHFIHCCILHCMSSLSIDIAGQKRFLGGSYHQGYKMRTCVLNASIDSLRYFSYALVDLTTHSDKNRLKWSRVISIQKAEIFKIARTLHRCTAELRSCGGWVWCNGANLSNGPCSKSDPAMKMGPMLWWALHK